jgi:hypothetical protein
MMYRVELDLDAGNVEISLMEEMCIKAEVLRIFKSQNIKVDRVEFFKEKELWAK